MNKTLLKTMMLTLVATMSTTLQIVAERREVVVEREYVATPRPGIVAATVNAAEGAVVGTVEGARAGYYGYPYYDEEVVVDPVHPSSKLARENRHLKAKNQRLSEKVYNLKKENNALKTGNE